MKNDTVTMAGRMLQSESDQYNRIFIIGTKDCSPPDVRAAFEHFGEITDVYMPRGKSSNEYKGIAYVTYSKASEAALAIEEMNGKSLKDTNRSIKVVLANSKSQGNARDVREEDKMMRLFIMIPTSFTDKEVKDEFSKFGRLESVHIVKNRNTGLNRGLAYVRFTRAYDAAVALETCDPKFKPMFADTQRPRGSNEADGYRSRLSAPASVSNAFSQRTSMDYDHGRLLEAPRRPLQAPQTFAPAPAPGMLDMLQGYSQQPETVLEVSLCPSLNQDQITRLFDIVPGLDTCHYDPNTGKAYVKYLNPNAAAYARDKLNMLEYPPGYRMNVQFIARSRGVQDMSSGTLPSGANTLDGVQTLVASIQQAMSALQQVGAEATGSYRHGNTHLPPGPPSYGHSGKRTYDGNGRSALARKSSRFS